MKTRINVFLPIQLHKVNPSIIAYGLIRMCGVQFGQLIISLSNPSSELCTMLLFNFMAIKCYNQTNTSPRQHSLPLHTITDCSNWICNLSSFFKNQKYMSCVIFLRYLIRNISLMMPCKYLFCQVINQQRDYMAMN